MLINLKKYLPRRVVRFFKIKRSTFDSKFLFTLKLLCVLRFMLTYFRSLTISTLFSLVIFSSSVSLGRWLSKALICFTNLLSQSNETRNKLKFKLYIKIISHLVKFCITLYKTFKDWLAAIKDKSLLSRLALETFVEIGQIAKKKFKLSFRWKRLKSNLKILKVLLNSTLRARRIGFATYNEIKRPFTFIMSVYDWYKYLSFILTSVLIEFRSRLTVLGFSWFLFLALFGFWLGYAYKDQSELEFFDLFCLLLMLYQAGFYHVLLSIQECLRLENLRRQNIRYPKVNGSSDVLFKVFEPAPRIWFEKPREPSLSILLEKPMGEWEIPTDSFWMIDIDLQWEEKKPWEN